MNLYLVDGARLRALRERASLSREELSRAVGPYNRDGERLIQDLERQDRVHVVEIVGRRISGALGVGLSDLTTHPRPPGPASDPVPPSPNVSLAGLSPTASEVDAAALKSLRVAAGLSPHELEERAGLGGGWVNSAESASEEEPFRARRGALRRIAAALDVETSQLEK